MYITFCELHCISTVTTMNYLPFIGCPLRGKQIYTIKGTLVCTDDYNKLTSSSSSNHSLPAVALMKDSRDPVLFQRIIKHSPSPVSRDGHTRDHMINGDDHMINSIHNSATMV